MARCDILTTSLRALMHPASIAAALLLAVNDHLLKEALPCWLTGKASDVAGLFFFPFLLAIPLTLLPRRVAGAAGPISFILTLVWFTLAKATPAGNELTTDLVSALLGYRAVILLDPTDLIGLLSLLPAWRLWRTTEQRSAEPLRIETAVPVALAAGLAAIATSPSREPFDMVDLRVAGDTLFARTMPHNDPERYHASVDGGRSWRRIPSLPESAWPPSPPANRYAPRTILDSTAADSNVAARSIAEQAGERRGDSIATPTGTVNDSSAAARLKVLNDSMVTEMADPGHPEVMYRIHPDGPGVERSGDSGRSWRLEWQPRDGRTDYIRHTASLGSLEGLDIVMIPGRGDVVVAIDVNGVLVRDSSGRWSEHGYMTGGAFTTEAATLGEAFDALGIELWALWTLVGVAPLAMGMAAGIRRLRAGDDDQSVRRSVRKAGIAIALVTLGMLPAMIPRSGGDFASIVGVLLYIVGGLLGLAQLIRLGLAMRGEKTASGHPMILLMFASAAAAFIVPITPLLLWGLGTIQSYSVAVPLSMTLGALVLAASAAAPALTRAR